MPRYGNPRMKTILPRTHTLGPDVTRNMLLVLAVWATVGGMQNLGPKSGADQAGSPRRNLRNLTCLEHAIYAYKEALVQPLIISFFTAF